MNGFHFIYVCVYNFLISQSVWQTMATSATAKAAAATATAAVAAITGTERISDNEKGRRRDEEHFCTAHAGLLKRWHFSLEMYIHIHVSLYIYIGL